MVRGRMEKGRRKEEGHGGGDEAGDVGMEAGTVWREVYRWPPWDVHFTRK